MPTIGAILMTERQQLVQAALAEVRRLRERNFCGPDECVLQLLQTYPSDQSIPDLLWTDLPDEASVRDIADLLSLWSWRTDDNGSSIMRAVERWIDDGVNEKQIAVALNLDAYPFVDHGVRIAKVQQVAAKFPGLARRCENVIAQSEDWMSR